MPLDKSGRPIVGEADPETRRKMLREALNKPTRGEGVAARAQPKPKKKKKNGTTLAKLLDPNQARERTVEGKDESLSEAVERGVKMGTKKDEE